MVLGDKQRSSHEDDHGDDILGSVQDGVSGTHRRDRNSVQDVSDVAVYELEKRVEGNPTTNPDKESHSVTDEVKPHPDNTEITNDIAFHMMEHWDKQEENGKEDVKKDDRADNSEDEIADGVDDEENVDDESYPEAPDGGYSWIILVGAFIHFMIFGGLNRCGGLFFLEFQSRFNTSAQLAAWPGALMGALGLLMGPVCGAVANRFSVRTGFMIGTTLNFVGVMLTSYAPNVYVLFLSHTILGGLGKGLMSCLIIIALYFDKHRSLAMGVSQSGMGVGAMWVPPLIQYLFDYYTFQGAFLIIAAICLQGYCSGMIFRPLSMQHKFAMASRKKKSEKYCSQEVNGPANDAGSYVDIHSHDNTLKEETSHNEASTQLLHSNLEDIENAAFKPHLSGRHHLKLPTSSRSNINLSLEGLSESILSSTEALSVIMQPVYPPTTSSRDGCLRSSLKILLPVEHKRKGSSKAVKTFHWDLFRNVAFMIFAVGMLFFLLAYTTAFTFIPAIALERGLTDYEAALVLTISGAVDTFGRIATGFIMNIKVLQPFRQHIFNSFLLIVALSVFFIPFMNSFAMMSVAGAVLGLMSGAFLSQKEVVLMDYLGRQVLPSSLGIQKAFQGIGALIGPPLAGALRDSLGNFDIAFYLSGACMMGAGIMVIVSTILFRVNRKKT